VHGAASVWVPAGIGSPRAVFGAYEAAGVDSRFSGSVVAW
jgi:hypothetical protein